MRREELGGQIPEINSVFVWRNKKMGIIKKKSHPVYKGTDAWTAFLGKAKARQKGNTREQVLTTDPQQGEKKTCRAGQRKEADSDMELV